jgi:conjugative relaxase-like TrwC/TraI family protein
MLFISPKTDTKEAKDYFTRDLSRPDYYLKDAPEIAGEWHGLGAELLGLAGTVDKERYFQLCDNINPATGEQLTPHTRGDRRVLYDFTFDAPKSVSLAYELGGDERIMDELRGAVKDTMSEMEGAMMTRVRTEGRKEDRATSNMVWAEFIHRTTRPVTGDDGISIPDPQLHCHAVAFNCTWDPEEERFKAAEFSNLVRDKGLYQAAFHSRLAGRLAALGYGIERDGNSFRLSGIDHATAAKFSKRTEIIEAEAERLGITNAKAKGELGRRTREKKDAAGMSVRELRKAWEARLSDDERKAIIEARNGQKTSTLDAKRAMDYALSHSFERASVVPEKDLLKTALIHSVGNASVNEVRGELSRDGVIRRVRAGLRYATTKDVLQEEIAMSAFVRNGRGTHYKLGGENTVAALDPNLSKEQCDAAQIILNSRDRVTALKGGAGTGKTRMMQATVAAIKAAGKEVYTFAPSAEASRGVLRGEGFANAETVERLLIDPEMQKQVHGQVLWVDEAGLLSVKDMKRLFDVAKAQDARVILSGDTRQHNAVYRGDALRILEKDAGLKTAELSTIRRQTNETYRQAVKAISEGGRLGKDGKTGLEAGIGMLDSMGSIIEAQGDERYREIAKDYAEVTAERKKGGELKTALVVSPTHREGERVTEAIRETLKSEGRLGTDERNFLSLRPLNLTEAQRGDLAEYRPGAVVQFHQNAKGFKRGERVTVVDSDKGRVRIKRADGKADTLPLSEAKKFQVYLPQQVALSKGDRLRITQNGFTQVSRRGLLGASGKDRLNNGSVYEVDGFTRQGDIKLANGFVVPKEYGGLTHGYVVTSHASQGKTVDVSLIALGSESFAAANREQFYVSVSRGREAVRLYTDDKAAMMDAVQGSAARLSATELMEVSPMKPKPRPGIVRRMFERVQRAYRDKLARLAATDAVHQKNQREGITHGRQ